VKKNQDKHKILAFLGCGNTTFAPFFVWKDGSETSPDYVWSCNLTYKMAHMHAEIEGLLKDDLYFELREDSILCRRVFQNLSDKPVFLKELGIEIAGISFNKNPRDDYFYHAENPRIYEVMTFPVDYNRTAEDAKDSRFDIQAGNRWADPGVVSKRIGASPYQPFPAVLLSNYQTKKGLVHGTLSQDVFYHNYLVSHEDDLVKLEIFSSFKAIDALEAAPGRILVDYWYLGTTNHADDLEKIFSGYTEVLREVLPPGYGATDINRTSMVWGSWNDGIFRDVCEEMLLEEAQFIKDNFPTVKWIQLDDGYAVYNKSAHGLGVPYEGEEGIDKNKFPNGLRHYTDTLRAIGIRPAIWIGGFCPVETKIFKEHPEWFIDYSERVQKTQPLDVSQAVVREYMLKAIDTLILEYGFEGVKLDFWSYAFEDSHDLCHYKTASGYENRRWWLSEIRKRLAPDGYLQTGCDIVMGNPFLGEFFTNYRYGIDIGTGNWDYVKTNLLWGVACFATHTGDLFVPNSDAIGLFPGLNDTEAMFCINYCLVTHSMVEIAGRLSKADENSPRLKVLKKAACNPNNGQDVYFAGYDYRSPHYSVPKVMYFKTPHFSPVEGSEFMPLRTVGLFNIEDDEAEISFTPEDLGLKNDNYILTDVWSGEQFELKDRFSTLVEGHGSRLLAVSSSRGRQLYDANVRINSISGDAEILIMETDYPSEAEMLFDREPKAISFNNENLVFNADGSRISFRLPGKGTLKAFF
jgi:hypothetical protein